MYCCPILMQAQHPLREDISKLKEDIKQEMMVCIYICLCTHKMTIQFRHGEI